ncbi:MAG: hypothetical protein V1874_07740 [Spirochaetota bacterium]
MKNKYFIIILILAIIISISILTCSPEGTSSVTIRINLGLNNKAAFNVPESSILDRVLCFFAKNAEAQSAPSHITSLTLNITGSGMDTITQSYTTLPLPDSITVEVPSGSARTFEVLAYTASATLRGAATRDLAGGETVDIPITMGLYETKIVIPDYLNQRIVQIDGMAVTGWTALTGTNVAALSTTDPFTASTQFRPYDIDFDSNGRIFIANNYGGSGMGVNCVLRVDNISGTNYTNFSEPEYDYGITAIAVDRNNDFVYYAVSDTLASYILYRSDLDGNNETGLNITSNVNVNYQITSIFGITVDDSGVLYIAGLDNTSLAPVQTVFKYNPTTQQVLAFYQNSFTNLFDIHIKGNSVYVSSYYNWTPASNYVFSLDTNLQNQQSLLENPLNTSDDFYGPRRFVALTNRKIYITDEKDETLDRLVAFDDISGSNWETYGTSGTGTGAFNFFWSAS